MKKLILTLTAAALFVPALAVAKQRAVVEGCLKGTRQSKGCAAMVANYWKHNTVIERVSREEGVDPKWMKSLIAYESMYNSKAVSPVSATGLTQVMPATAMGEYGLSRDRLYHPETSVRAGARYLKKMHKQFGRMDLALAAYNAGPGRVQRAGNRVPNIPETQAYVRNIIALHAEFERKERGQNGTAKPTQLQQVSGRVALPEKATYGQYGKQSDRRKQARTNAPIVRNSGLNKAGRQPESTPDTRQAGRSSTSGLQRTSATRTVSNY